MLVRVSYGTISHTKLTVFENLQVFASLLCHVVGLHVLCVYLLNMPSFQAGMSKHVCAPTRKKAMLASG